MDDSAVFAVRAKYAEDLEQLLQCPVCFERPEDQVVMCVQGHHLCKRCRDLLIECPVCKGCFSLGTRNFVVEELCSKLNEIITLLLEPQFTSIALPLPPVAATTTIQKSISTQTHINNTPLPDQSLMIIDDHTMSSCPIGFCQSQLPADSMYYHVSDHHSANLIEARFFNPDDSFDIYKNFKLKYDFEKLYDFAINNKDFGLFFLNVHIDKKGDLYFTIQTSNASLENKFLYELSVSLDCAKSSINYDGLIPINLTGKKYLRARKCKKDFFKSFFKNKLYTKSDERFFMLSLTIMRN